MKMRTMFGFSWAGTDPGRDIETAASSAAIATIPGLFTGFSLCYCSVEKLNGLIHRDFRAAEDEMVGRRK
jgi:hypothetical protein